MEQMIASQRTVDAPPPYVLVEQPYLDLSRQNSGQLKLSFGPSVWDSELFLVIDLYAASNPVHPGGHLGWWKWPLEVKGDLLVDVTRGPTGYQVTFDGAEPEECWVNPDFNGLEEAVIALHVVLRPVISEAVRFDDVLHVYTTKAALENSQLRRVQMENLSGPAPSVPWFVWPRQSVVHLVSTNLFERDAVGNYAFSIYRLLRASGVPCQLYAGNFDPTLRDSVRHTCEVFTAVNEDDLLLVNFSIFEPWLPRLVELPCKKVMYFHNITPPRFLQVYDAEYAVHCTNGIAQLKHAERFDLLLANSASSARVLSADRAIEVSNCPPLIGERGWESQVAEPVQLPPEQTLLLYVGRVAPHKRIEDLFAMFDRYHQRNPDSALVIVGSARFDGYLGFLRYLLSSEYAGLREHIHFYDTVSDGQLKSLYQAASAFVTMSEHEGFCVPLLESMAFEKPVFAFADEAVLETLGCTGRIFYEKDFDAIAAEIDSVLTTPWIKRLMIANQNKRMVELVEHASGDALWTAFEKVLYGARTV